MFFRCRTTAPALTLALVILCICLTKATASDIAVLNSSHVKNAPSEARIRAAIDEVLREFQVPDKALPNIIVIFITRNEAKVQRLPANAHAVADRLTLDDKILYHLWVVDDPTDTAIVEAIVTIVQREAGTHRTAAELAATTRRICVRLKSKIAIGELRD